jgi:hypothetical protein
MNVSADQETFEISCEILGNTQIVITKLPSEGFVINHIFAITFNGILIIPTMLLNVLAIITIIKSSQLKGKPCYFIILVQSMVDLAVGALSIPSFLVYLVSGVKGMTNCFVATLALRLASFVVGTSSITLSALTLERYIAILHPFAYRTRVTKRKLLMYVGFGVAMIISTTILSFPYHTIFRICVIALELLIFAFIAFAYTRIFLVIKKLKPSPNRPDDADAETNTSRMKSFFQEIKHAKSCFIVVLCYCVLCFLPAAIAVPLSSTLDKFEWLAVIVWGLTLHQLNASINSVIFFWTKKMLRNEAAKVFNTVFNRE